MLLVGHTAWRQHQGVRSSIRSSPVPRSVGRMMTAGVNLRNKDPRWRETSRIPQGLVYPVRRVKGIFCDNERRVELFANAVSILHRTRSMAPQVIYTLHRLHDETPQRLFPHARLAISPALGRVVMRLLSLTLIGNICLTVVSEW